MKISFLYKNVSGQINSSRKFHDNWKLILVCSGAFTIFYNEKREDLHRQDWIIIPQRQHYRFAEKGKSDKTRAIQVLFEPVTWVNYFHRYLGIENYTFLCYPQVIIRKCASRDFIYRVSILRLLNHYMRYDANTERAAKKKSVLSLLFISEIADGFKMNQTDECIPTNKGRIVLGFFEKLRTGFSTRHNVGFYADALCITTGYLNRVLKDYTGRTAKQNIQDFLVREAEFRLLAQDGTVRQISDSLGFPDDASFSHFFKKQLGISPAKYRLRHGSTL